MASDPKLLMALLIGTNNLGMGHLPDETASGVKFDILKELIAGC